MLANIQRTSLFSVACLALLAVATSGVAAAPPVASEAMTPIPEFVVVRIEVSDTDVTGILDREIDVWDVNLRKGIVEAAVDTAGRALLDSLGLPYQIDHALTAKYNRPFERLKDQVDGIPGYPCYRTVEETLADGAALAAAYPDLAEWIDIGDSWEKVTPGGNPGYDMMVLRLTNVNSGIPSADKPRLWLMGAVHARELTTAETVTRFAEYLLANYDVDPDVTWILDHHEVHIQLQSNPDGRKKAESGLSWRKNTNENYCGVTSNYRGADLNRNHDFEWGCCGGSSSDPCSNTFRGASAASEPETQAVRDWITANFPDWRPDNLTTPAPDNATGIFIDVHSYGGDVFSAFGFQDPPAPNDAQMLRLGRKFSYFNGYYAKLGSNYAVDGATKDFGYGRIGMPAYTFELGSEFFQDCAPFESTIYPDNLQALLYAARAVQAPYTQSSGPEVLNHSVVPLVSAPGDVVTVTAVIDDTRYGPGETSPSVPIESIAAAEVYVGVPPWQAGAAPIPMTAVDGSFDSSVEAVTVAISSLDLSDGRHLLYVRGQDSAGYWGTTRALFFWFLDPLSAPHVAGRLTDAETGLPVEGIVSSGIFTTASDPGTGSYDLVLPAGTHNVTAEAGGYGSQTATGVVATAGVTTVLDFALQPYEVVMQDDVETGNQGWSAQGQWAITTEASASPSHSWTDSPGTNYGNYWDYSLTSPALDLYEVAGVVLEFKHIHELESGYDYGFVEYSTNGGSSWTTAASFDGFQTSWETAEVSLPDLDHVINARVRFRLDSDSYTTEDGWHIDDIVIRGFDSPPPGMIFRDRFESGNLDAWSAVVQ
jgi:hypothetical protein